MARVVELTKVDLSSQNEQQIVAQIAEACKSLGMFHVVGHGIDEILVEQTLKGSRSFFELPTENKIGLQLSRTHPRGYIPYAGEMLDPSCQHRGDTKECFHIGRSPNSEESQSHVEVSNRWPKEEQDEEQLAAGLNNPMRGWRVLMTRYFDAMHALGDRLVQLVAVSLGLDRSYFAPYFTQSLELLRLVRYAAEASVPAEGVFACGQHTDYGLLTILKCDSVPGLEVFKAAEHSHVNATDAQADKGLGEWLAVPDVAGGFVVNLGNMLQRWTNDRYKSPLHRVVNREGRLRHALAFFVEPNHDAEVSCIPELLEPGESPRYSPVKMGMHLAVRYAATHIYGEPIRRQTSIDTSSTTKES